MDDATPVDIVLTVLHFYCLIGCRVKTNCLLSPLNSVKIKQWKDMERIIAQGSGVMFSPVQTYN